MHVFRNFFKTNEILLLIKKSYKYHLNSDKAENAAITNYAVSPWSCYVK